jgi:hypothetical protein
MNTSLRNLSHTISYHIRNDLLRNYEIDEWGNFFLWGGAKPVTVVFNILFVSCIPSGFQKFICIFKLALGLIDILVLRISENLAWL